MMRNLARAHYWKGLQDPGLSVLDGVGLYPTLDLDFTGGRTACHRIVSPATITQTRASQATYFQNPVGPGTHDYIWDLGNNVLRYGENNPVLAGNSFRGIYDTRSRWVGLLIEGGDQNIIVENKDYAAVNWTLAGGLTASASGLDLYESNAFKLVNGAAGEDYMYQTHLLTAEKYIVCFFVWKDPTYETTSADDNTIRVAAGLSGAIAGVNSTWETIFENAAGTIGMYLVWAEFTATAANWDIGVNVRGNKTAHIQLLSCYKSAPTNEGGSFVRTPIPTGAAAATRAHDCYGIANDSGAYMGISQGTVDFECVAPCSEAEAATNLTFFEYRGDDASYLYFAYAASTDRLMLVHRSGGVSRAASSTAAVLSRSDIMRVRCIFNTGKFDGTNYLGVWLSLNGGAWAQIITYSANALGGNLDNDGDFWVGALESTNIRHIQGPFRRLRIYNRSINGYPGDWGP